MVRQTTKYSIDLERCELLAKRSAEGDTDAWKALVEHLWPHWLRIVKKSPAMRRFVSDSDGVHDVVVSLVSKIGGRGGHNLTLYSKWRERNPESTFEDWFLIVTANAVRDYVRSRASELAATRAEIDPDMKGLLNDCARSKIVDRIGERPPYTAAQTARALLEYAEAELPSEQFEALSEWLQGSSFEELEPRERVEAQKRVRAACASLRRRFAAA
jgi:hypothetical protein